MNQQALKSWLRAKAGELAQVTADQAKARADRDEAQDRLTALTAKAESLLEEMANPQAAMAGVVRTAGKPGRKPGELPRGGTDTRRVLEALFALGGVGSNQEVAQRTYNVHAPNRGQLSVVRGTLAMFRKRGLAVAGEEYGSTRLPLTY